MPTNKGVKVWFLLVTGLLVTGLLGVPAYWLNSYCNHLNNFIYHIEQADQLSAEKELDFIGNFIRKTHRWRVLKWFGDRYFFSDFFKYEAVFVYLIGDYNNVINSLKERTQDNDSFVFDLLGRAKFRLAQAAYQYPKKTKAERQAIIDLVVLEISEDFKRAVQNNQGAVFDYIWNYDLSSEASSASRALAKPMLMPVPKLGDDEGDGDKLAPGRNKNEGKQKIGEENKALPGGLDKPKKKG